MDNLFNLIEKEKNNFFKNIELSTMIEGDLYEIDGKIDDVFFLKNEDKESFILINFKKGGVWNEYFQVLFDMSFTPLGKIVFALNDKDSKISFDYFFVRKDLRGQGLGQSMLNFFFDFLDNTLDKEYTCFCNPYSFDVSFNGIKGGDYKTRYYQFRLEQFYLDNDFVLVEDPRKYVFGEYEEIPEYPLSEEPVR